MSEAKPLGRVGGYRIPLSAWTNPLPVKPLSAEALKGYYLALLRNLEVLTEHQDEARNEGRYEEKYRLKIVIKTTEAVAELVHGIVEPRAPFLCDTGCQHVGRPLEPERCKALLDALDAFIAEVDEKYESGDPRRVTHGDRENEMLVAQGWRRKFAGLMEL